MALAPTTATRLVNEVLDLQRAVRCIAATNFSSRTEGLGAALHFVLRLVGEGECRATGLASSLGIGNPVLSRHIAELEDQGLVTRRRDPKDGRAQLVAITPRGASKLQLIEEERSAIFKKHLQDWEEDEALQTIERLNHLTGSLLKPAYAGARHNA